MSASTAGWIAIAAVVLALVGLIAWGWTLVLLSRARAAQRVLLGGRKQDLVDFAVSLQARIDDVLRAVDEIAGGLSRVDRRVDGAVSKTSIVRYDALSDVGGASVGHRSRCSTRPAPASLSRRSRDATTRGSTSRSSIRAARRSPFRPRNARPSSAQWLDRRLR